MSKWTRMYSPGGAWTAGGSETSTRVWVKDENGKQVCVVNPCVDDFSRAELIASLPELLAENKRLRKALKLAYAALPPCTVKEELHIVFDGPPSHESGRFVEVETAEGKSVSAGEWQQHGEYWHLVLTVIRGDKL